MGALDNFTKQYSQLDIDLAEKCLSNNNILSSRRVAQFCEILKTPTRYTLAAITGAISDMGSDERDAFTKALKEATGLQVAGLVVH